MVAVPGHLQPHTAFFSDLLYSPLTVLNSVLKVKTQGSCGELRAVSFFGKRTEDKELGTNILSVQGLLPKGGDETVA